MPCWDRLHAGFAFLRAQGVPVYVVGGACRDFLIGRDYSDLDLVIHAESVHHALRLVTEFATLVAGRRVVLDTERGIVRIVLHSNSDTASSQETPSPTTPAHQPHILSMDFSQLVGRSLSDDLQRRDFTINSIAWDVFEARWIDCVDGISDLRAGRLRTFYSSAYADDPLRVLRALRMLCTFPLTPALPLLGQVRTYADLVMDVASERIRNEILGILDNHVSGCWQFAVNSGIVEEVFPELRGRTQQAGAKLHLFEEWQEDNFAILGPVAEQYAQHLSAEIATGYTRAALVKLATLLSELDPHAELPALEDNGSTNGSTSFSTNGSTDKRNGGSRRLAKVIAPRSTPAFTGRLPDSSEPVAKRSSALDEGQVLVVSSRFCLSNREQQCLASVILQSARAWDLCRREDRGAGWHQLMCASKNSFPEVAVNAYLQLKVELARQKAKNPAADDLDKLEQSVEKYYRVMLAMLEDYFQEGRVYQPNIPLSGDDLVRRLGMKPGPMVGKILARLALTIANGEAVSEEQAYALAQDWLKQQQ